jgi:peptidoglycan/xylan/chitin deacetylase (PgdA/CDA1 family)
MSTLRREIGLSLYRWVTARRRARLSASFEKQKNCPAIVLFYHRVATETMNSWSIQKRNFDQHLDWISKHATPASLDDIRESQMLGTRSKPMVAVTFDDGYGENCEYAIPALIERGIPCTYFVATHYIETGEPFPHDRVRGCPLRPNTIQEIQRMADQGIQIGAHSHTHLDFGRPLSDAQIRSEITDVRKRLQDWTGQSIDYFAFPFGLKNNITLEAIDVVFESGFKCFVSAAGGMNWPGQDANHLQRVHGDPGLASLLNWLTYDPRKIHVASPIQYEFRAPHPAQRPCVSTGKSAR